VFSSVTAVLNLSVFQDQFVLQDLIQELERKSAALSFGPLQSNGHVSVRGSFPEMQLLRDFLLLKAKSLSEKDKGGKSRSHQRPKRRLQQHQLGTKMNDSVHDADGEKHVVVLDTDIYHYMKSFSPRTFLTSDDVVISDVVDGDITTVCIESAGSGSDAGWVLRVKERIEHQSSELHSALRKERICFEGHGRSEKQRYKRACESLKPRYPRVLIIPYDTHIDVIGNSSQVFEFVKEASS
ncbi:RBM43 protein, partial [Piaya cayana]|nr:RBM43 protein [Piaya cayana]